MSPNPLLVKPVQLEALMAVIRSGGGPARVIRMEPEIPYVNRLTPPKEEPDMAFAPNLNPIAFLGMCALAVMAILFALAAYLSLIPDDCDCPRYVLRRQSGRGLARKTMHLSTCYHKEKA